MKINKTSHPILFHYRAGGINLFGLLSYIIEDDLKIKSTREDRMDLANENEKNGDRRNTYK
jgi:hypothetical protein